MPASAAIAVIGSWRASRRLVGVVAERREDGGRRDEHGGRAEPPAALERRRLCAIRGHVAEGSRAIESGASAPKVPGI